MLQQFLVAARPTLGVICTAAPGTWKSHCTAITFLCVCDTDSTAIAALWPSLAYSPCIVGGGQKVRTV